MNAKVIGGIVVASSIVMAGIIVLIMNFSYKNSEVSLRNQCEAQQKTNQAIYDEVWKVIKQKAQVTDKYAEEFKAIYSNIMNERYQGDAKSNPMFKFISEHNPTFSVDMYVNLSDTISAQRAQFTRVQSRLIDIKREHDNLLTKVPSKWFLGGISQLEIQIVTSAKTQETFATGMENDVNVF